ncbi:MAG TPA: PASTA domain-containing protein [Spirochaetales bacterium]|nr:PASTA domain-containing protein [Spirochaetales bacterium]
MSTGNLPTKKPESKKNKTPYFDFSNWTAAQKRTFVWFAVLLLVVFVVVALIIFFAVLQGPEKVMVPDVRNMDLADALVLLQQKELYPRLTLRFTNNPQDKNMILEQSPEPGTIVKAGRRIKLTVSKGAILSKVENYIGQDLESVKLHLQSLFTTSTALVTVREPAMYMTSDKPAGTILEQNPPAGTEISGPIVIDFVVSKGPDTQVVQVPNFVGLGLSDAVKLAQTSPITIDFALRKARGNEQGGVVVDQSLEAGKQAKPTDRMKVTLTAMPNTETGQSAESGQASPINGLFVYKLPEYPYSVPVKVEVLDQNGGRTTLASLKHPGGNFSLPFSLPAGSTIVLTVLDREVSRTEVKEQ